MIGLWGPLVRRVSRLAAAIWLIIGVLSLAACVAISYQKKGEDKDLEIGFIIPESEGPEEEEDEPAEQPEEENDDSE